MTLAEVETLLGIPPGDYRQTDAEAGVSAEGEGDTGSAYEALEKAGKEIDGPCQNTWHDGGSIETWFLNDRLAEKMYVWHEASALERVLDCLDRLFGQPPQPPVPGYTRPAAVKGSAPGGGPP